MTDTVQTASGENPPDTESGKPADTDTSATAGENARPKEIGGRKGPDPTRFGDWEKNGRCIDF